MEPKLVAVPDSLPSKVYSSAKHGISAATHDAHLGLYKGYANKTNEIRKALAGMEIDPAAANQIYSQMRALKVNYAFAYGGYLNHQCYFDTLGGEGGEPEGKTHHVIAASFGSFGRFVDEWKATGMASRGWAYLAYDHSEQRAWIAAGDSQDTFPAWGQTLLLAMDVYEHAYFLDFQTARMKYIEAYMQCIDWAAVEARMPK